MEVKQEIETNKHSDHCKLTMVRFSIRKFTFRFIFVVCVRVPEENIRWLFVVEELDSGDSEDWHLSDSESIDSDSEENE